MTFSL